MPNIIKEYQFTELSMDTLYKSYLSTFNEMGIVNIKEGGKAKNLTAKTISETLLPGPMLGFGYFLGKKYL